MNVLPLEELTPKLLELLTDGSLIDELVIDESPIDGFPIDGL